MSVRLLTELTQYTSLPKTMRRNITVGIIGDGVNYWQNFSSIVIHDPFNNTNLRDNSSLTYTDLILSMYNDTSLNFLNEVSVEIFDLYNTYANPDNFALFEVLANISSIDVLLVISPLSYFNIERVNQEFNRIIEGGTVVITPFGSYGAETGIVNPLSLNPYSIRVGVVKKVAAEVIDPFSSSQYSFFNLQSRPNYSEKERADVTIPMVNYESISVPFEGYLYPSGLTVSPVLSTAFLGAGIAKIVGNLNAVFPLEIKSALLDSVSKWETYDSNIWAGKGIPDLSKAYYNLQSGLLNPLVMIEASAFPVRSQAMSVTGQNSTTYLWVGEELHYRRTFVSLSASEEFKALETNSIEVTLTDSSPSASLFVPSFTGILVLDVIIRSEKNEGSILPSLDIELTLSSKDGTLRLAQSIDILIPKFRIGFLRFLENDSTPVLQDTPEGQFRSLDSYLGGTMKGLYSVYQEKDDLSSFDLLMIIDPEINASKSLSTKIRKIVGEGTPLLIASEDVETVVGEHNETVFQKSVNPFSWFTPLKYTPTSPLFNFGFSYYSNISTDRSISNPYSMVQDVAYLDSSYRLKIEADGYNATFPFLSGNSRGFLYNETLKIESILNQKVEPNNITYFYSQAIGDGKIFHLSSSFMLLDFLGSLNSQLFLPPHNLLDFLFIRLFGEGDQRPSSTLSVKYYPLSYTIDFSSKSKINYIVDMSDEKSIIHTIKENKYNIVYPVTPSTNKDMQLLFFIIYENGFVEKVELRVSLPLAGIYQWMFFPLMIGLVISLVFRLIWRRRRVSKVPSRVRDQCPRCGFFTKVDNRCRWCSNEL